MPYTAPRIVVHINDVDGKAVKAALRLEMAGISKVRDHLQEAIDRGTEGLETEIRFSALSHLPKRGGLASAMAASRISKSRQGGRGVGLVFKISNQYDVAGLDDGLNIHPLFGNKRHWYLQRVRRGWVSHPIRDREPVIDYEVRKAMDEIAQGMQ